jgi:hypothetical protein
MVRRILIVLIWNLHENLYLYCDLLLPGIRRIGVRTGRKAIGTWQFLIHDVSGWRHNMANE